MKILNRKILDPTILKLIRTGLKAKVFFKKQKDQKTYMPELATRQAGILSPLLSNIYLDLLDKYILDLCEQYQGNFLAGNSKKKALAKLQSGGLSDYYRLRLPSTYLEAGNRNCKYIRYADDFVIGIQGPYSMAIEIRDKVKDFLEQNYLVLLSLEKTKITHISKGIEFLGYKFSRRTLYVRQSNLARTVQRKMQIALDVKILRVVARLSLAGFCTADGTPKPAFRFLGLPQSLVNKKVNYILRALSE